MGDTNIGNQIIRWEYNQNLSSSELNQLWVDVINPGVYEGGTIVITNDTTVTIQPFVACIKTSDNRLVYCKTQENIQLTVSNVNPYITVSYQHSNSKKQYADIQAKAQENIYSTDIILGKCIYNGSTLENIDYSEKTFGKKFTNNVLVPIQFTIQEGV